MEPPIPGVMPTATIVARMNRAFITPPFDSAISDEVVRDPARLARRRDRSPAVRSSRPHRNRPQMDDLGRRLTHPRTQWLIVLTSLGQECLVGGVWAGRRVGQVGRRADVEDCRE